MNRNNSNHLSLKQRQIIETLLNESYKLCDIAYELHRAPRGIQKEISIRQNAKNKCGLQILCKKSRLCDNFSYAKCSSLCPDL